MSSQTDASMQWLILVVNWVSHMLSFILIINKKKILEIIKHRYTWNDTRYFGLLFSDMYHMLQICARSLSKWVEQTWPTSIWARNTILTSSLLLNLGASQVRIAQPIMRAPAARVVWMWYLSTLRPYRKKSHKWYNILFPNEGNTCWRFNILMFQVYGEVTGSWRYNLLHCG